MSAKKSSSLQILISPRCSTLELNVTSSFKLFIVMNEVFYCEVLCVCVWDNLFSFSFLWLCLYRWGCLFNSDSYFSFHLMFSSQGYRQGLCLARKIVALSSRESSHRLLQSDMFPQTSCRLHLNHTPLISSHLISAAHMCVLVHSHVFVPALLIFPTCSCFMLVCTCACIMYIVDFRADPSLS